MLHLSQNSPFVQYQAITYLSEGEHPVSNVYSAAFGRLLRSVSDTRYARAGHRLRLSSDKRYEEFRTPVTLAPASGWFVVHCNKFILYHAFCDKVMVSSSFLNCGVSCHRNSNNFIQNLLTHAERYLIAITIPIIDIIPFRAYIYISEQNAECVLTTYLLTRLIDGKHSMKLPAAS